MTHRAMTQRAAILLALVWVGAVLLQAEQQRSASRTASPPLARRASADFG